MARIANGDLVVVIPGILGSTLQRGGRQTWGYRQILTSLHQLTDRLTTDLALPSAAFDHPHEGESDGTSVTGVLTTQGIIPGLVRINGYDDLLDSLRRRFRQDAEAVVAFPYDWRQSNGYTARRLQARVEPLLDRRRQDYPAARLVLVAHSMGGLVARYYAQVLDHRRLTRRIVTIGTPYQGAVRALAVLASGEAKLGPFTAALGDLTRTLPSVAELLPVYPCLGPTLDDLTPPATTPVPALPAAALTRCLAFHQEIAQAIADHPDRRPTYHPLLSHRQATDVWAQLDPDTGQVIAQQPTDFADRGDGTVPRRSATPPDWDDDASALFLAGTHGALQQTTETYRQLAGILTATPRPRAAAIEEIAVDAAEMTAPGLPWTVTTSSVEGTDHLVLTVTLVDPDGTPVLDTRTGRPVLERPVRPAGDGTYTAALSLPGPGLFRWTVSTPPTAATPIDPISDLVLCLRE